ncbi:MAG: hypothetical protein J6X79_07855 [Bacteroidales bacterium]|nr:hypothetical protein [Bacteroidales bacterium]
MNIDQTLEQLSHLQCPHQVDVTDRVMAQVEQHPYLRPQYERGNGKVFRRIGVAAVAAALALVVINVATVYTRSYDEEGLGSMIAQYNDYSSWNTVEEAAVNPLEYLYEE